MSKGIRNYLLTAKMISTYEGASVEELAEELEISRRSVFNVIRVLEETGFAIYTLQDPENPKRVRYKTYNSIEELFCA